MPETKYKNARDMAAIFASIAVPIILALVGWKIQTSISDEGVRKDYVQMALNILDEPKSDEDAAMRQWAVAVLEKNSPVPFTNELRQDLFSGIGSAQAGMVQTIAKSKLIVPPQPWLELSGKPTIEELVKNYSENKYRMEVNNVTTESLHDLIKQLAIMEAETGVELEKIDQEFRENSSK